MPLSIDAFNKLVLVTSPTTEVSAQVLHDFVEDYMASPVGLVNDGVWPSSPDQKGDILKPEGKIEDENNPGVFSQIILILHPEWQVQFFAGSGYTRLFGGKFTGGVNGEVLKATGTAGDLSVLESQVDGVVAASSGLTAGESAQLNNIDSRTSYHSQIINNYKELLKIASSWYLIIYDDGETSGGVEILRKRMTDSLGGDISDLTAGVLAAELASTV